MSEIFDEVQEEVRREQLRKLWSRYGGLILFLAVLVVAGVGGWRGYTYWQGKQAAEAGARFEAAVTLSDEKKSAEAEAAFMAIAKDGPTGYRALAKLRAAGELATRDPQGAVKLYDEMRADSSVAGPERDLAALRAGSLLVDTAPYAEVQKRLEPLTTDKGVYRHSAREMLAVSAWRNKDTAAARSWIEAISADAQTPQSLRSRVEALQALLPASAKS